MLVGDAGSQPKLPPEDADAESRPHRDPCIGVAVEATSVVPALRKIELK